MLGKETKPNRTPYWDRPPVSRPCFRLCLVGPREPWSIFEPKCSVVRLPLAQPISTGCTPRLGLHKCRPYHGGIPEAGWPVCHFRDGMWTQIHLCPKIPLCWVGQGVSQLSPSLLTRKLSLPLPLIFRNKWERESPPMVCVSAEGEKQHLTPASHTGS